MGLYVGVVIIAIVLALLSVIAVLVKCYCGIRVPWGGGLKRKIERTERCDRNEQQTPATGGWERTILHQNDMQVGELSQLSAKSNVWYAPALVWLHTSTMEWPAATRAKSH